MKARKQRTPSDAEKKARAERYGGTTRREFNARHQRPKPSAARSGSFEVVALFEGNPVPQTAPFPNESAALARFERLSTNASCHSIKVIENVVVKNAGGEALGLRQVTLYALTKLGQEFANSKVETLYQKKGGNSILTYKMIRESDSLSDAMFRNEIEVYKRVAVGGEPWWDTHRERRA